jgi:hypothetical protein
MSQQQASTSAAAATTTTTTTPSAAADIGGEDHFDARPSHRLRNTATIEQADGSTWQEFLAVAEVLGKLQIRSYYQNRTTGKRVWDEPPTGASHVIPATKEMHRMATLQLDELYIATGNNDDSNGNGNGGARDGDDGRKKSGGNGGFMKGLFFGRKKGNDEDSARKPSTAATKIRYRPGSKLLAAKSDDDQDGSSRNLPRGKTRSTTTDRQFQTAIARSIADSQGRSYPADVDEDEELAIAKALSLSSSLPECKQPEEDEDEILRQVLEQSRLEAQGVKPPPNW